MDLEIKEFDRPDLIGADAWNAVVQACPTATVFQTYQWHAAWHATLGKGTIARIFGVFEHDTLIGIAPLCELPTGQWQFMAHDASDYADFIVQQNHPDVIAALLRYLVDMHGQWRTLVLQNLPEGSATVQSILEQCPNALVSGRTPCPTLVIKGREREFSKVQRKKSLRRHRNFFRRQDDYAVSHCTRFAETEARLPAFFEQHAARWRLNGQASLFDDPVCREFYQAMTRALSDSGWLVFTMLQSGGRAIAYHLGFSFRGRFIWYKPSFDPALARKSPGEALLAELLEYADQIDASEFDFTVGNEAFKRRFANEVRHNQTVELYASRFNFALRKAYLGLREGAKRFTFGRALLGGAKRLLGRQ